MSSLSLTTNDNTESWKYVVCKICTLKFQNEADMEYHALRVHEYGERCELYPCEKCGFSGTDIDAINFHNENFHGSSEQSTNNFTLEDTGIEALPVYSKRKKQNFDSLVMDDDGNIEVEESDDEYSNDKDDTEKLLAEDDYEIFHP